MTTSVRDRRENEVPRPAAGAAVRNLAAVLALALALPAALPAAAVAAAVAPAEAPATPAADLAGHWEGTIELPNTELVVKVDLAREGEAWTGTIDIPAQGASGLALGAIRAAGDSVSFELPGVPGQPVFRGRHGEQGIAGTFSQSGYSFPFHLGREAAQARVRPQDPQRPLPYREQEVAYESPSGKPATGTAGDAPADAAGAPIHLAATLTLPPGDGPFPAAVLITGSGSQNRDEELMDHRPFLVLSDYLTRAGIAVLRADDRGVGGSTGSVRTSTTSDFADDALAGVRYLRTRPEIDPDRIGLVGHSEGGIAGPLAASRAPDEVAFVVMIAGTGVPLEEVILRQSELIELADGEDSTKVASENADLKQVLDLVAAGADSASLHAAMQELGRRQVAALPDSLRPPEDQLQAKVTRDLAGMISPWFRFAVAYDPRPALRQVRCPVLALNGTLDLQVDPEQNLPEIEKALREGGNPDVTILRLPGLNHLLQTAKTGSPAEYQQIEETMSPAALSAIGDWILARTKRAG